MKNNKNFCLILILLSLMASPLMNAPLSQAAASAPKDNALTFLADVVSLDLPKYNVTLVSDRAPYNVANGVGQEEVRYKLENSKNILRCYITIQRQQTCLVHPLCAFRLAHLHANAIYRFARSSGYHSR
jgi:hypothetical protein